MTIKPRHDRGMALFLIFSESWQSFCQTVQQTFPMRGKTLPDNKYVFQNPYKKLKIGRTATGDLNKSAALAIFQKKSDKKSHFPASFWNPAPNRD